MNDERRSDDNRGGDWMDTMRCSMGARRYFVRVGGFVHSELSNEMKALTEVSESIIERRTMEVV